MLVGSKDKLILVERPGRRRIFRMDGYLVELLAVQVQDTHPEVGLIHVAKSQLPAPRGQCRLAGFFLQQTGDPLGQIHQVDVVLLVYSVMSGKRRSAPDLARRSGCQALP